MSVIESMQLGDTEYRVSRLGFGCWAIGGHGWGKVNDEDSRRAVRCALERGITFFDTADVYGLGKSENVLAEALGSSRHDVVIATKGGVRWDATGKIWTDISPGYLRSAVEASLSRLKVEQITLYYIHKPDQKTPIQASVEALERMRQEGKIGAPGVSNFTADELRQALEITKIAAVQIRANVLERSLLDDLLPLCREHNISLVAWGALADGLLTGKFSPDSNFTEDDHRSRMPLFKGDAFVQTLSRIKRLGQMTANKERLNCQLALRWLLDYSPFVCALFGAKTEKQVHENSGASGWHLTDLDMTEIDNIVNS